MSRKQIVLAVACGAAILFGGWQVVSSFFGGTDVGPRDGYRAVNVETGHQFTVDVGGNFGGWPVEAPDTGQRTGYPAETCKCGNWVVLNKHTGKKGPTTCSKCGATVSSHRAPYDEAAMQQAQEAETKPKGKKKTRKSRRGRRGG